MRLDLAERLRCPNAQHAPTPLVVVARAVVARDLREGIAGCPLCSLEARFHEGHLVFGTPTPIAAAPIVGHEPVPEVDAAAVERIVALLGLAEPGGAVLLTPGYAALADALADAAGVDVVLHDPAGVGRVVAARAVHGLPATVPFADGTFRAVALDGDSAAVAEDALRAVAPRGRVLGAVELTPPAGLSVLARDAREWVGERGALSGPMVTLGRRGG